MSKASKAAGSSRYINRELSWLAFNARVLEEAQNERNPLLERLKFLAISGSNMDEFFMVRVAGLHNQLRYEDDKKSVDGRTAAQQLELIYARTESLSEQQRAVWDAMRMELHAAGVEIVDKDAYSDEDMEFLRVHFAKHIKPTLTPIAVDATHPFPLLPNLSIAVVMTLKAGSDTRKIVMPVPDQLDRFINLPCDEAGKHRYALLEEVIHIFQHTLFADMEIVGAGICRLIRDSELSLSDAADDLVRSFESALERRRHGYVIRLEISEAMPKDLQDFVVDELETSPEHISQDFALLAVSDLMELYNEDEPGWVGYKFPPNVIRFPERIDDYGGDCFAAISAKDIIVHHPYESFDVVVQFIRQAAADPDVIEIKQTLYRTSNNSPIVRALIEAAEAGKSVTVCVELRARFDEEANLSWGRDLERAGAQVIYGVPGYKTHAKIALVHRKEGDEVKAYAHFGTGNYHPGTARVYSDLSFFTCDEALCRDAAILFQYLSSYVQPKELEAIAVAPFTLRTKLLELISNEAELAKAGKKAAIWIKVNSLVDRQMIDALYEASQAGVKITLVVRGICCLRPGVAGLSENITVKSIVGRFLEHTRLYCFSDGHGLPSPRSRIFIGSADLMPRNLDKRIEVLVPVTNPTVHAQVQDQIMHANIKDKCQSWVMNSDGDYERVRHTKKSFNAHDFFLSNPSLSGRGSALNIPEEARRLKIVPARYQEPTVATASAPMEKAAVIDIGSNSVRMVIYDAIKRAPIPLFNEKVLCGLAKDMQETGKLYRKGKKEALRAMKRFVGVLDAMQVNHIMCFATSAVRDSEDGREFVDQVQQECGIQVHVLSGEEEARYSGLGVAASFFEVHGVVGDLGGGSLELASLDMVQVENFEGKRKARRVRNMASYPIGALRLRGLVDNKVDAAENAVNNYLQEYPFADTLHGKSFYAVGGGFRSLAKIHMKRIDYPFSIIHHYIAAPENLLETLDYVTSSSVKSLKNFINISDQRLQMAKMTAVILERIIALGKPSRIVFSSHGVREGVLYDQLIPSTQRLDGLISGAEDMIHHIAPNASLSWVQHGHALYDWMSGLYSTENDRIRRLRKTACILGWLGWYDHSSYRAETAFRWVMNAELASFNHAERGFVATALYHRYSMSEDTVLMRQAHALMDGEMRYRAMVIGLSMQLGYSLSGGACEILQHSSIALEKKKLVLSLPEDDKALLGPSVMRRLDKLASVLGVEAEVRKL